MTFPKIPLNLTGPIQRIMPVLFQKGQAPVSSAQLMDYRIESQSGSYQAPNKHVTRNNVWANDFHTSTLWLHHPDKGGKIVPYNPSVEALLQSCKIPVDPRVGLLAEGFFEVGDELESNIITYPVLPLPDGFFEHADGLALTKMQIENLNNQRYNQSTAKQSEVWRTLADGSQDRLDAYVNAVFKECKSPLCMDLIFGPALERPTYHVIEMERGTFGSSADFYHLAQMRCHLLGVMQQSQNNCTQK